MQEIPVDFIFEEYVTLEYLEDGMRAVEHQVKLGFAYLAACLGRIKREGLYLSKAPDFKTYLRMERTSLKYRQAVHLAAIGEKYWKFKPMLDQEGITLTRNMNKIKLLDGDVIDKDPMFWVRFKELSVRELKRYIDKWKYGINVYPAKNISESVSVNGISLTIDGCKLRGLNLKEARENIRQGRRAVVLWVDDDNEARRIKRVLSNLK